MCAIAVCYNIAELSLVCTAACNIILSLIESLCAHMYRPLLVSYSNTIIVCASLYSALARYCW